MIRYRPRRSSLSAEYKDEQIFHSMDEMFVYLLDHWSRIMSFVGCQHPVSRKDILIDGNHNVLFNRKDKTFCIGVYEE